MKNTSKKKLCLIYANCQRDLLRSHLKLSLEFTEKYYFAQIPYHFKAIQNKYVIPDEILNHTFLFIYQPVKDEYKQQSTKFIVNKLPKDCIKISFPYVYFTGYHPQFCKINSKNLKTRFLNDGSNIGDKNIINLFNQKTTATEIINKLRSKDFYTKEFLLNNVHNTLAELSKRERNTDIKISQFIRDNYQDKYLFLIPAHPTNIIGLNIVNQILNKLDIPPLLYAHSEEELNGTYYPIYPSTSKQLELNFIDEDMLYKPNHSSKFINFEQCINYYIDQTKQENSFEAKTL